MAAGRRRRNRRVRFRSHRGRGHAAAFRSHKGRLARRAFAAHATRAIRYPRPRRPARVKAPKITAFKSALNRNPYPVRARVAAYKSALRAAPAAWSKTKRKPARYKPAKPKRV